jgi:drug/metabolite transporter (DMT)-like permease
VSDQPRSSPEGAGTAKLLLLLLSFAWGLTWATNAIALREVTPWTVRIVSYIVGTVFIFGLVRLNGRNARVPFGVAWVHLAISGLLSVAGFGVLTVFAQTGALTSRVVIVSYSMPVWSSLLAWPILGERLNRLKVLGLLLCVAGLIVLVSPLLSEGLPFGLALALAAAVSWAAGTVYLKWAQLTGDMIVVTAWQILVSLVLVIVCVALLEGVPHVWPLRLETIGALVFTGIVGTGIAYFLWFSIVGRVSAATASLGSLCVPVVGILSSVLILGERPDAWDALGFTLISCAAACVLLQPSGRGA